jgi:lactate dehydrogenase-like 2-hydroxyacid dehydrogenase
VRIGIVGAGMIGSTVAKLGEPDTPAYNSGMSGRDLRTLWRLEP